MPGRYVHRVELTDLEPGRPYWFVVGDSVSGFSPEWDFRTIPDTDEPLRFIAAGDTGVKALSQQLQAVAAAEEPLFVLLGGDLAYTNGDWNQWPVWDQWLDNWQQAMVTPSGFTVPMVSAIGNPEVAGGYGGTPDDAPIYLKYLAQAGDSSYYTRRIGPRLCTTVPARQRPSRRAWRRPGAVVGARVGRSCLRTGTTGNLPRLPPSWVSFTHDPLLEAGPKALAALV